MGMTIIGAKKEPETMTINFTVEIQAKITNLPKPIVDMGLVLQQFLPKFIAMEYTTPTNPKQQKGGYEIMYIKKIKEVEAPKEVNDASN